MRDSECMQTSTTDDHNMATSRPDMPRSARRMQAMSVAGRFRFLAAVAGVVLATGLVIGSSVSFAGHSAEVGNMCSAGTLAMSNTPTGMSVAIRNMVPGDFHTGTVVIKNTGDEKGHFYLEPVAITHNTKGLAERLDLVIKEGNTKIYDGRLSRLTQKNLGTWNANESHTYTFKVTFPDNGRTRRGTGRDNAYMGATTSAAFNWTAVGSPEKGKGR